MTQTDVRVYTPARVIFVGHSGGTPGYEGQIDVYPRNGYAVVILTNEDQAMMPAIRQSEEILTSS